MEEAKTERKNYSTPKSDQEITEIIKTFEESCLPQKNFCNKHDYKIATFHYWIRNC
ncbi:MAG: hypothetical protein HQK83_04455 [Fibrobacteria bacterium]|nr:hypothetical protein [Fibrobacteria bacterium]